MSIVNVNVVYLFSIQKYFLKNINCDVLILYVSLILILSNVISPVGGTFFMKSLKYIMLCYVKLCYVNAV